MKKTKLKKKTEVVINLFFIKIKMNKTISTEETSKKSKSKKKLIRSKIWKILEIIIEQMIASIISAFVNGLFYQHLILKKNEFFYREVPLWLMN